MGNPKLRFAMAEPTRKGGDNSQNRGSMVFRQYLLQLLTRRSVRQVVADRQMKTFFR